MSATSSEPKFLGGLSLDHVSIELKTGEPFCVTCGAHGERVLREGGHVTVSDFVSKVRAFGAEHAACQKRGGEVEPGIHVSREEVK